LLLEVIFFIKNDDYSQFGEQAFIIDYFNGSGGCYLDVGAGQPVKGSNTFQLYRCGWRGVCVDPIAQNAWLHRIIRRKDFFVRTLVGNPGRTNFWQFEPSGYSTTSAEVASQVIEFYGRGVHLVDVVELEIKSMHEVAAEFIEPSRIRFISIDVEGADSKVLRSNDWNILKPELICIEQWGDDENSREIEGILAWQGYHRLTKVGLSVFWKLNEFPSSSMA
jgi:Methyltransferase FkbM domain